MPVKRRTKRSEKNLSFSDRFYSDIYEDGMLYASIFRSPVPKGRIIDIHIDSLPDGYCFFDINDVPGSNSIKSMGGDIPVFSGKDISYLGQPIGIITGPNRKIVRKLCKELKIDIDEHFLYDEKQSSSFSEKNNLLAFREIKTGIKYEKGEDDIEIEDEWESEIKSQSFSETNGAFCHVKNQKLYVFAPNRWTYNLRKTLCEITGFSPENIFITRTNLPDKNTDILWLNTLICCQCAVAAIKLSKPVKLEFTRNEQRIYAENTSAVKIYHKTIVDKSGILKSMEISIHVNAGAFNPFAQEIADRLAISSIGLYDCPNIAISSKIYKSHSIPSSIDFSIIDSKAFFAVENQMNKIASLTGFDPMELRLKNIAFDAKKQKSPFFLEQGKSSILLSTLNKNSVFLRKYASYKIAAMHKDERDNNSPFAPPLRGIGLSLAYEGTGYLSSKFITKKISVEVTLTENGKLFIKAIPPSPEVWKIWQSIASETLGIPSSDIINDTDFELEKEPENPKTADASITITTRLIKKAAETLKKKDKSELPLSIKKSFTASIKRKWKNDEFSGYPFSSTSPAAMIVEVELDPATFREYIRGIWFIADAGKVLNPKSAEISVRGAIQEGLRELVDDDETTAENISIQFLPSDEPPKQIGEVVTSLLPSAYASALSQVSGKTVRNLPLQTDSIFNLLSNNSSEVKEK